MMLDSTEPSRRRCRLGWLAVLAWVAAGCGTSYTIAVKPSDIAEALHRQLPASQGKLGLQVTIRALDVELAEVDDRIFLRPEVEASVLGQGVVRGQALVTGHLRYQAESGALFLADPKVTSVEIDGLPEPVRPVAAQIVSTLAEGYLDRTPVFRLRQSDFKQALARLVLKSVRVHHGRLEITLGVP